jgi:hypothetical protein
MLDTQKLAALADKIERSDHYDQGSFEHCVLGHHFGDFGDMEYQNMRMRSLFYGYAAFNSLFGTTDLQSHELFGQKGCDDAGKDGKRAAAFIRNFILLNKPLEEPMRLAA